MDCDLKFHKQTAVAVKKANISLGIIKKAFAYLDSTTLTTLYKALVRPNLEYGNVVWGITFQRDKILVERVKRRATRMKMQHKISVLTAHQTYKLQTGIHRDK